MDVRNRAVAAAMFVGIVALAGCSSEERFRPDYLSSESRLVGGGLVIKWEAPEPGTAYLVEKRTGKLIQTVTLEAGQPYEFEVRSVVDADDLETLLGISVANAQFLLYFKPGGPTVAMEP
jgi:hypothetical protein